MQSYIDSIHKFTLNLLLLIIFSISNFCFGLPTAAITYSQTSAQQHILPVKNGQIAYYRFGKGSPIVLITGYGATLSEWNTIFLNTLADKHEVIVFDNRGVGQSLFSTNNYTINDLTDDVAQLITGLKLQKPTILGWSMGGMIAQSLAIQHTKLIGKLILMGTKIGGPNAIATPPNVEEKLTDHSGTKDEKFNRVMNFLFPPKAVPAMSKIFVAQMFKPSGQPEPSVSIDIAQKQQAILTQWKEATDVQQKLQQLSVPTLILTGTDDVIIPPKNAKVLAETIPGAQLKEIKHGGHAMMYQYPKKIAWIIDRFIEKSSDRLH